MSKKLVITLDQEYDAEVFNPSSEDGWKVYSFGRRHYNYKHAEDLGLIDGEPDRDLRKKLDSGLAFPLSYFEHGQCLWSLQNELPPGADCPWDSVRFAGMLVWEQPEENLGPETVEDRREDARNFIKVYTEWCNGECYSYSAEIVDDCKSCGQEETVEELDGCGGFIGGDALFEAIRDALSDELEEYPVEFRGPMAVMADYYMEKVK